MGGGGGGAPEGFGFHGGVNSEVLCCFLVCCSPSPCHLSAVIFLFLFLLALCLRLPRTVAPWHRLQASHRKCFSTTLCVRVFSRKGNFFCILFVCRLSLQGANLGCPTSLSSVSDQGVPVSLVSSIHGCMYPSRCHLTPKIQIREILAILETVFNTSLPDSAQTLRFSINNLSFGESKCFQKRAKQVFLLIWQSLM